MCSIARHVFRVVHSCCCCCCCCLCFKRLLCKEKESPSQLSDFIVGVTIETNTGNSHLSSTSMSTVDELNNQSMTNDEQQPPVSRAFHAIDVLPRKASSNMNSSVSSSTSISPIIENKCQSRSSSSSTSSSSNVSIQKKTKGNDETMPNTTSTNQSLNDLSQFVQLNKDERSFLPPAPPSQQTSSASTNSTRDEPMKTNSDKGDNKYVQRLT
jgi:hypothetical protein